jgi:RNA polymerase sigma-70 factor, ECF subfamily
LHDLIRQLRPLDQQVMLVYLEQLDAGSIAEITGLSTASVFDKGAPYQAARSNRCSYSSETWS